MAASKPVLAYVVNALHPGGTEKLVVEMSTAFSDEFVVKVVCLDEPGAWATDLRRRGVAVHCLWRQPGLDLSVAVKLARCFRKWGVRIVHAHQCTPWFYSAMSRLFYPAPRLLLEEHGRFYPEVENWKRVLVNRLLVKRLTHRFIAVSEDVRERLARYEGLNAKRIEVFYNGVKPMPLLSSTDRMTLRAELGFGPEDFIVGTVGRFDPIKNLPMLIEAVERAATRLPKLRAILVGNGPEFAKIAELIASKQLADRIKLTGYRSDAQRVVQCLELFVLSSFSEGTSMALLEAMSAGVAVAVTAVGGNPEIVSDELTGWVVPSSDVARLSQVIEQACGDDDRRLRYGAAGRARFDERFSFTRMLDSYRQCYRQLLAAGS